MGTEATNLPKLAAPARRALPGAGYTRLEDLTKVTESDVMKLHGMGQCHAGAPQRPEGARPVLPRWMIRPLTWRRARWSRRSIGTASVPDGSPWWPVQGVAADQRASQHRQGREAFRGALRADPQPPPSAQPGPGSLDPPAVAAKLG
jgi:hypothetical protein